ncbi:MAG TPA: AEC family transporter [Candidatus Nanoperiomorbaceae bacterium]|nr:AEC family transporter [Candidatus Nanoperiomorbaceae bacterium]HMQ97104.1 AEC family transporter [Candidatus Nanoperiomorbaceae bacterium]HMR86304.1 AEC family transporter [Candidatus Nanoperiomorbaceae bacterium]HMU12225.1 AEC family transporter [Candidatus Nanoperiomorbaceae bacterium]
MQVDLSIFYSSLASVALIVGLGWVAGKREWIDEHTNKTLVNLLINVAWPCALLGAFPGEFRPEYLNSFLYGLGGGVVVLLTAIVVSKLLFPRRRNPKNYFEYQFAFIFNNASFLGFPLVNAIYGQAGLVPYAGFIVVFNLALFGYGVSLFRQQFRLKDLGRTLVNPNVIAVVVGFLLFLFSMKLPGFVGNAVGYTGAMMTPLSLIAIGYMLSRANLLQVLRRKILVLTCLAQLILGPLITFVVSKLIGAPNDVIHILVLIQALPTATSLGLFAEKYRDDTGSASELVAISTVLSALTLPLVMWSIASLL